MSFIEDHFDLENHKKTFRKNIGAKNKKAGPNLISAGDNPETWVKSTFPPEYKSKTLVKVYEISDKKISGINRQRMWLHDILDDNGILYRVEFSGYWAGRRKYVEVQEIYVEEEHFNKVRRLIIAFHDPKNIVGGDEYGEKTLDAVKNGIPQAKCSSCGNEVDFDFYICPYCKKPVYK